MSRSLLAKTAFLVALATVEFGIAPKSAGATESSKASSCSFCWPFGCPSNMVWTDLCHHFCGNHTLLGWCEEMTDQCGIFMDGNVTCAGNIT